MDFVKIALILLYTVLQVTHHVTCEDTTKEMADLSSKSPETTVLKSILGAPCNTFQSCRIRGAFCIDGVCACHSMESVADISSNKCLRKAIRLGDPCIIDLQCSAALSSNSKCGTNNTCICTEDAVPNQSYTECLIGDKLPGEPCSQRKDCVGYPDKSDCRDGMCECRKGYLPSSNVNETSMNGSSGCLPIVNRLWEKCEETQQCQQGALGNLSICASKHYNFPKICVCTKDAVPAPLTGEAKILCHKKVERLGDSCKWDEQCNPKPGRLAFAKCSTDNRCVCFGEYLPNAEKTLCLQPINRIGGRCVESQQCIHGTLGKLSNCTLPPNSENNRTQCQCTEDAISVRRKGGFVCYRKAEVVGDPCEVDKQCMAKLGKLSKCSSHGKCITINSTISDARPHN